MRKILIIGVGVIGLGTFISLNQDTGVIQTETTVAQKDYSSPSFFQAFKYENYYEPRFESIDIDRVWNETEVPYQFEQIDRFAYLPP